MITPKQFFISYAHEDVQIAEALALTLRQIDDTFVVVSRDKVSLESGLNFRKQLEEKLKQSEVLFVVHTDVTKPVFGFTGWEVGYFEGVHLSDQSPIISLHLDTPPATTSDRQGIGLNITADNLRLDTKVFKSLLDPQITKAHPLVRFMDDKRQDLASARRDAGLPASREVDTVQCVREMIMTIFQDRKNAADTTIKPQKQITIKTQRSALEAYSGDLPADAELVPIGAGAPMSVFGLPEVQSRGQSSVISQRSMRWADRGCRPYWL
jgi:hypothetical protein